MGKSVGLSTLMDDLRFVLDLQDTSARLTDVQAERLINKSLDNLFGVLLESHGEGRFTYCIGIEIKDVSGGRRSVPLPQGRTGATSMWGVVDASSPTHHSPGFDGTRVDAPAFQRLLKVQLPESYTSTFTTESDLDYVAQWSGRVVDIPQTSFDRLGRSDEARAWTVDRPPSYRLIADTTLFFDPPPSAPTAVLVWYVGNPLDVTVGDVMAMEPDWSDFVVYDAAATFAIRDRDSSSSLADLRTERAKHEAAIRTRGARSEDTPEVVRRPYRDVHQWGLPDEDVYDLNSYGRYR